MELESVNLVALVVAIIGVGGFGVFFREIVGVITLIRNGVSAKEAKRKNDLVYQRDQEYLRAESEMRNRLRLQEYASRLRRRLIEHGREDAIGAWPEMEDTLTRNGPRKPDPEAPTD